MASKKPAGKSKTSKTIGTKAMPPKARKAAAAAKTAKASPSVRHAKTAVAKAAKPPKRPAKAASTSRPAADKPPMKPKTVVASKATRTGNESKPVAKSSSKPAPAESAGSPTSEATTKATAPAAAAPAERPAGPSVPPVVATAVTRGTLRPQTVETPSDAEEGEEGSSLLAGPRNVKPYIAKRGEQYMNREQLEHFRQILLNWKRDLMEEVDRTVTHMKDEAANFPDPNDRATQEEEFSLELRTRDRERKLIRKIDEALKRIEDGSYGYCLETGEEIGIKRLEARPVATLSIEAQERRERRERQYGDRDDRYR